MKYQVGDILPAGADRGTGAEGGAANVAQEDCSRTENVINQSRIEDGSWTRQQLQKGNPRRRIHNPAQ